LELDGDVASALSANSLVGEKTNTTAKDDKYESKMLLFNGLYYRGAWAHPFQQLSSDDADEVFHKSESEEQTTKFMRSRAVFKYAAVDSLDVEAIELPYENERYALLMVMPNKVEGLTKLMSEFTFETLAKVCAQLELESVQLRMPKFTVESTGRVEKALAKVSVHCSLVRLRRSLKFRSTFSSWA
jgi:serine protease inhibitor